MSTQAEGQTATPTRASSTSPCAPKDANNFYLAADNYLERSATTIVSG
jgi:hypothetical protein